MHDGPSTPLFTSSLMFTSRRPEAKSVYYYIHKVTKRCPTERYIKICMHSRLPVMYIPMLVLFRSSQNLEFFVVTISKSNSEIKWSHLTVSGLDYAIWTEQIKFYSIMYNDSATFSLPRGHKIMDVKYHYRINYFNYCELFCQL